MGELAGQVIQTLLACEGLDGTTFPAALMTVGQASAGQQYARVMAATPACSSSGEAREARLKTDAQWWSSSPHKLTVAVFEVLNSGQPWLNFQPDGAANLKAASLAVSEGRKYRNGRRLMPLLERSGYCFGVLLVGPHEDVAVPVELAAEVARWGGILLEEAWRRDHLNALVVSTKSFVMSSGGAALDARWLVAGGVAYDEVMTAAAKVNSDGKKEFVPFESVDKELTSYRIELSDAQGKALGLIHVKRQDGQPMMTYRIALLQMTATSVQQAVHSLDRMNVGDSTPKSLKNVSDGFQSRARLLLPYNLQMQMRSQLAQVNDRQISLELATYKDPPAFVCKVMVGVLCLLDKTDQNNNPLKADSPWGELHLQIDHDLIKNMLSLDFVELSQLKGHRNKRTKANWKESKLALASVTLKVDDIEKRAGYAVRVMLAWLEAAHLVNQIAGEIRDEESTLMSKERVATKLQALSRGNTARSGDISKGLAQREAQQSVESILSVETIAA